MKSKIEVKQEERTIALQEIKTSIDRISELVDHISKLIDGFPTEGSPIEMPDGWGDK